MAQSAGALPEAWGRWCAERGVWGDSSAGVFTFTHEPVCSWSPRTARRRALRLLKLPGVGARLPFLSLFSCLALATALPCPPAPPPPCSHPRPCFRAHPSHTPPTRARARPLTPGSALP